MTDACSMMGYITCPYCKGCHECGPRGAYQCTPEIREAIDAKKKRERIEQAVDKATDNQDDLG